jgi:hypothetical protein
MFLRGCFGDQQKRSAGRTAWSSGASKPMGLGQLEHGRHRRLEALDASMRDGHAMPQTGRTQAFAGEQAVGDQGAAQAVQAFKQQAGFFKSPFSCWWRPLEQAPAQRKGWTRVDS